MVLIELYGIKFLKIKKIKEDFNIFQTVLGNNKANGRSVYNYNRFIETKTT